MNIIDERETQTKKTTTKKKQRQKRAKETKDIVKGFVQLICKASLIFIRI